MVEKWKVRHSDQLNSYGIFSTRKDSCESSKDGKVHDFYVIQSPDWINVIPVTEDDNIVLIRQFRHGTKSVTLEIPGGMVDEGEVPEDAAKRELLEETGYEAGQLLKLGVVDPNPAIMDNKCHIFLAVNSYKVAEPAFDGTEDIESVLYDHAGVKELIRYGGITHSLVLSAFGLYFIKT